jgi:hypothetical protein
MKNKKTLYILIPVAFFIWGLIGYKIYFHFINKKEITSFKITENIVDSKENKADTFTIVNNYRDPFLDNSHKPEKRNATITIKKNQKKITWPEIIYTGRIYNQKTKKSLVSLRINGMEKIVKPGEEQEGVFLSKAYDDSVKVRFEGESKTIIKQK